MFSSIATFRCTDRFNSKEIDNDYKRLVSKEWLDEGVQARVLGENGRIFRMHSDLRRTLLCQSREFDSVKTLPRSQCSVPILYTRAVADRYQQAFHNPTLYSC